MKLRAMLALAAIVVVLPLGASAQAGGRHPCGRGGCNPPPPSHPDPTPVPEPSDGLLLLIGAAGVAVGRWQQRRKG